MRDVFELEPTTNILRDDSYLVSYPHLISYFAQKQVLKPEDVVRGAHMAYGWMPTKLELYPDPRMIDFPAAADLLSKAKASGSLKNNELKALTALVNNSLVGVSKLLHFISPSSFAIWDTKVYAFVHEERPHNYRVNQVPPYLDYLTMLSRLEQDNRFPRFHASVKSKVGYAVSPFRALELVMHLNAPVFGG